MEQAAETVETTEQVETEEATTSIEEAVEEAAEVQIEEEPADDSGEEPEKKTPSGVQKRINELVRQREIERQRADDLEKRLYDVYTNKKEPEVETKKTNRPVRPDYNQFDTQEDYDAALDRYSEELTEWKINEHRKTEEKAKIEAERLKKTESIREGISRITVEGEQKYSDFLNVAYIPKGLEEFFINNENGIDLAYYLGNNPEEIKKLHGNREMALIELGRLDAKLSYKPDKTKTKAPSPIKPVSSKTTVTEKEPGKMSDAEFEIWFRKQRGII